jgi:hypothetical protein
MQNLGFLEPIWFLLLVPAILLAGIILLSARGKLPNVTVGRKVFAALGVAGLGCAITLWYVGPYTNVTVKATRIVPHDVVLLVDDSGSTTTCVSFMRERDESAYPYRCTTWFQAANKVLANFVRSRPFDNFTALAISDEVRVTKGWRPGGDEMADALLEAKPEAAGTDLARGLRRALDVTGGRPDDRVLIIASDGQDQIHGGDIDEIAQRAKEQHTRVIWLNTVYNDGVVGTDNLRQIVRDASGQEIVLKDAADFDRALVEITRLLVPTEGHMYYVEPVTHTYPAVILGLVSLLMLLGSLAVAFRPKVQAPIDTNGAM